MASQTERLAELVAAGEAGLAARLPRQLAHGDFWDDNVFFRGETAVFVADISFMAERARIDDLALTRSCCQCCRPATSVRPPR